MIKKFIGKDHTKCSMANLEQNDLSLITQLWKLNIQPLLKYSSSLMFASYIFEIVINHFKFVKRLTNYIKNKIQSIK